MPDKADPLEEFRLKLLSSMKMTVRGFLRQATLDYSTYLTNSDIRILDWSLSDARECIIDVCFSFSSEKVFFYTHSANSYEQVRDSIKSCLLMSTRLRSVAFVYIGKTGKVEAQQKFYEHLGTSLPSSERTPKPSDQKVNNQTNWAKNYHEWEGLKFRSLPEIEIAKALDKVGVLFFPNCMARLGTSGKRILREPDFLVCHKGKWGIIEVDGDANHPPSQLKKDQERMRAFRRHAIQVIEHYDAKDCLERPDEIVAEFLEFLEQQK